MHMGLRRMHAGRARDRSSDEVRDFLNIVLACSAVSRLRGLLGRNNFDGVLLLSPCNDIHTFGMRRAVDVAFITSSGLVLEAHRNVGPCRRLRCKQATATLERFATQDDWYERGDCVELKQFASQRLELK